MDLLQAENDTSPFSASTLLSGDGDSSERDVPDFPRILHPDLDYQYDAPEFWEEVSCWALECTVQGCNTGKFSDRLLVCYFSTQKRLCLLRV